MPHRATPLPWLSLLAVLLTLTLAGCTTDEADEARAHATAVADGQAADPDAFHVDVELARRYTGSKWREDKDHVFTIKDESHVRARVEFHNVRPERTYSVHMVWIKPDGEEAFRRYAEVRRHLVNLPAGVEPDSTGALPETFVAALTSRWGEKAATRIAERLAEDPTEPVPATERVYRDAEDLGDTSARVYIDQDPSFRIYAYLNISREKERPLGDYLLRIYLDRRLLREVPFEIRENT
jgi:hypothetical protein